MLGSYIRFLALLKDDRKILHEILKELVVTLRKMWKNQEEQEGSQRGVLKESFICLVDPGWIPSLCVFFFVVVVAVGL